MSLLPRWPSWWPYRPDPDRAELRAEFEAYRVRMTAHNARLRARYEEARDFIDAYDLVTQFYTWRLTRTPAVTAEEPLLASRRARHDEDEKTP